MSCNSILTWAKQQEEEINMESITEAPALYSLEDAARSLGKISSWTLRKHLKLGTIKPVRIGRRLFISAVEIRRLQAEGLPSLATGDSRPHSIAQLKGQTHDIRSPALQAVQSPARGKWVEGSLPGTLRQEPVSIN